MSKRSQPRKSRVACIDPWGKKWAGKPALNLLLRLSTLTSEMQIDEDDPADRTRDLSLASGSIQDELSEMHWISEELEHRLYNTKYRTGPALHENPSTPLPP